MGQKGKDLRLLRRGGASEVQDSYGRLPLIVVRQPTPPRGLVSGTWSGSSQWKPTTNATNESAKSPPNVTNENAKKRRNVTNESVSQIGSVTRISTAPTETAES